MAVFSRMRSVLTSLVSLTLVLAVVISEGSSIFVLGNAVAGGLADKPPTKSFLVTPGQAKKLEYDGATLGIGADAVTVETTISITPLNEEDFPALSLGMANTTTEPQRGYRLLPHGMKFQKPIEVALKYDKNLIPEGLTEEDIETFYFDDQTGSWQKLKRVAVDTKKMQIISLTDHFTDMINATVVVPEHAPPLALDPNSMKDVKAADPSAGINLIEAPGVSNMGDARLTYPIEVPPGRRGMQPQLAITYSSGASNGWLGLGWDLVIPAVTIDTRWGVPRYDEGNETETYLLNGEQLTPVAHRNELQPRSSDKKFHIRVEGQFREIIRHGSSPSDYWWEVIDREGTRYLYGGDFETNGLVAGAILANDNGDIFRWELSEVRDPNGNGIQYTYVRVDDTGIENGTITGYQLYLKSINYTQSNGQPGAYTVTLVRDRELGRDAEDRRNHRCPRWIQDGYC